MVSTSVLFNFFSVIAGMYDECPQVSTQLLVSDKSKLSTTTSLQSLANMDAQ